MLLSTEPIRARASPGRFPGHSSVLAVSPGVRRQGAVGGTMDMDMARARPSNGRATCMSGGGPWCSAFEPLCRHPAAPPSPLGPSRTPTAPLMQGVAVELKKYEVGRDQDAKGVVQELRGACRRGRLRPVGTQTTQQVRVGGRRCRPEVPRRRGTPPPPSAACLPACSRKSLPRGPRTSPQ